MKEIIFFSLSILFTQNTIYSQTQFRKACGGPWEEIAYSIIQTTDGGYAVTGYTDIVGYDIHSIYVVRLDGGGNLLWAKSVGEETHDEAYSMVQAADGGFVLAGVTQGEMSLVKLDGSGMLQWAKNSNGNDRANSIIRTTDSGYAVAGYTQTFGAGNRDIYILKLNSSGNLLWTRTVGGTNIDEASSIIQTTDGGYVVAGRTESYGAGLSDMLVIKLNGSGTLQWSTTIGGTLNERAYSIIQTTDGGYVAAGVIGSSPITDCYIVKLNSSGNLQWTRTVGGAYDEYAYSLVQTADGGYAVAGTTNTFGQGGYSVYIIKLDSSGALQWSRTTGGGGHEFVTSLIRTADGGYAAAGYTYYLGAGGDMYILKFDANWNACGNPLSAASTSGTSGTATSPAPTVTSPPSVLNLFSTSIGDFGTLSPICLVNIQPASNKIPDSYELFQNYPNPFNPISYIRYQIAKSSNVKLTIFDARGREIASLVNQKQSAGTYEVNWDASNYPSGAYFYKLTAGDYSETRKMVLLK